MTIDELKNRFTLKHISLGKDTAEYWNDLDTLIEASKRPPIFDEEHERYLRRVYGIDTFDSSWRRSSTVDVCERSVIASMVKAHYLGKWPGVVVCCHVMRVDGAPVGMIVWALPPRETAKRYGGLCWELARLWVEDSIPRNAETWLIGKAVKWIKRNRPDVKVLVSYADPSAGHQGYVYRAANWTADGRTDQERKTPRCDYIDNTGKKYSRRGHVPKGIKVQRFPRVSKWRYVYRLDGHMKKAPKVS